MIIVGDCLEEMRKMEANSISCIVTDPPYFLINNSGSGFMGKSWDSVQGLSKYLWLSSSFVSFAISLLSVMQVEKHSEGESIVRQNASTQASEELRHQIDNALSVKENSQSQNVPRNDSAHLFVLTKQEVWDWLRELCSNHIEMLDKWLSGVKSDALFVIPTSSLKASVTKNIAPKTVLPKLKVKDFGAKEILLSSTDLAGLKNAIEVMIGTRCGKVSINETIGLVGTVGKNAPEKRFSVITSSHIEKEDLTTWITSLLCAINATARSNTIPNYLIQNFYTQVFREAFRICKPGSHVLAFGGTRTYHLLANSIESSGFEVRDCIMYCYGSGFPKSHNFGRKLGGEWSGFGTALKPAHEPIIVAMKPLEGTYIENADKWGVAGINIDACRVGTKDKLSIGSSNLGYHGTDAPKCNKQHASGRWPANIIFDEEAGKALDQMSGELKSGSGKKRRFGSGSIYKHGFNPSDEIFNGSSGGASRFFYCPKASSRERNEGLEGFEDKKIAGCYGEFEGDGRGRETEHRPAKNNHPTVKPVALMEYLIKLVMPPKDGILLDPFAGSGSTLVAAKRLGFDAIGIEMSTEYAEIAKARIASAGEYFDRQNLQPYLPFVEHIGS